MGNFSFLLKDKGIKIRMPQIPWDWVVIIGMAIVMCYFFFWLITASNSTFEQADMLCVEKHGEYSRVDEHSSTLVTGVQKVKCEYIENDKLVYACYTNLKGKLVPFDCADKELGDF